MKGHDQQKSDQEYLAATEFLDYQHPSLQAVIAEYCKEGMSDTEKAVALFYFVRDKVYYDPYSLEFQHDNFRASYILQTGRGFCVTKSALYAALLRGAGIPARLGYADVKNHLTSKRLAEAMGTDIFYYHGYTDVFLDGRWVKATPVFNIELCERAGLHALDFDGSEDSIFHPFSKSGERHMEYLNDRGYRYDLPYEEIETAFKEHYALMLGGVRSTKLEGDFLAEVESVS